MLKVDKILKKIFFIVIAIIVFLGYIVVPNYSIQSFIILGISAIFFVIFRMKKIIINKDMKQWVLFLIICIVSLCYSIDFENSFIYVILIFSLIFLRIILDNVKEWNKIAFNILYYFSLIHVVCTLIYGFFPTIIQEFNKVILSTDGFYYNFNLYKYGCNAGITSDHGANAIFITIFLALSFSKFLKNFNIKNFVMFILGIIALFLTGKRGPLIANIIPMLILLYLHVKNDKKKTKWFFILSISFFVFVIILNYIPAMSFVFERFETLNGTEDVLNGRDTLYRSLWNNISNHFLLGSGIRSTLAITGGNDGHNIYLQLFSEVGIVGLTIVLLILIGNLLKTFKLYNNNNEYIKSSLYIQIFFIIYGMTGNAFYYIPTILTYFLVTSSKFNINKENYKEEE